MIAGPKAMALMESFAGHRHTDLMTHFLPELLREKGKVAAFYTKKEWYDVGTVSSFEKLNEELVRHPLSFLV
jgi:NDP-sugar pyrophosphorylase family protein